MTRLPIDVAVIGSINADTTYSVHHLPVPGETILSSDRLDAPGGKGANQAVALAALGVGVHFVGAVGNDDHGRSLVQGLVARGVGVDSMTVVDTESTGSAVIVVAESGENSIIVHPGANARLSAADVEKFFAQHQPAIVMAQLEIPLETVLAATEASGATVIVNPAPMPAASPLLSRVIDGADIIVPNRTELAALASSAVPQTVDEVIACARKLTFSSQLVVTLGADGAVVFPEGAAGEAVVVEAPRVSAVDTSGAGDAFCAALAAGLHRGKGIVDATGYACEFASWIVTQKGAQVGIQAPPELVLQA